MGVIYTISHPFTNEIVYVGATKMLSKRANIHSNTRSFSPVSEYIQLLKKNYMLPKIEVIDFCDSDELMLFEQYWIQQLQCWGFNLLNKTKKIGIRLRPTVYIKKEKKLVSVQRFIKKTPEYWERKRELQARNKELHKLSIQANRKWKIDNFIIGKIYTIDYGKHNSFRTMFNIYAKKFDFERHLNGEKTGQYMIYTVTDGKMKYLPDFGRTKKGFKRYKPLLNKPKKVYPYKEPKRILYHWRDKKPGDIIYVESKKWVSFRNTNYDWNRLSPDNKKFFNYEKMADNYKVIFCNENEIVHKRHHSKETVDFILNSDLPINELSNQLNIPYNTIYYMILRNKKP